MAQTILFQNKKKTTINQQRSEFITRLLDGVGQDSNAPSRVSVASAQPLTAGAGGVTPPPGKNSDRVPNYSTRRRTVLAAGWVPKPISGEIDRIAKESGLTRSHFVARMGGCGCTEPRPWRVPGWGRTPGVPAPACGSEPRRGSIVASASAWRLQPEGGAEQFVLRGCGPDGWLLARRGD